MEFNASKPIYIQIADYVCDQIQGGKLAEETKIPSVRELAVMLEVNPNTVMRSFEFLQQQSIIQPKRGMGYFVSQHARESIEAERKETFLKEELPQIFKKMELLGLSFADIQNEYKRVNK